MAHTIEFSDDEIQLLRNALHAFFDDFGHEEEDLLRSVHELLAKLPNAEEEPA
jgi:hypothetical protein